MDAEDLVLLLLGASNSPIRGRTVIQKTGYFSHVSIAEVKPITFKPHYYGPYSPEIAAALSDLVAMGFVREEADTTPSGNSVYTYALTNDGRVLEKRLESTHKATVERIRKIEATCRDDANSNPNILSWAAKAHYLLRASGKPMSADDAVALGRDFNWELSSEDANRGLELLLKLGFVRPAAAHT
jgi:uncharacterized protein